MRGGLIFFLSVFLEHPNTNTNSNIIHFGIISKYEHKYNCVFEKLFYSFNTGDKGEGRRLNRGEKCDGFCLKISLSRKLGQFSQFKIYIFTFKLEFFACRWHSYQILFSSMNNF